MDGLIIYPTAWNIVYAVDAVTGETQWVFDPKVDRGRIGTIWAPFSRGIAVYLGRVVVATLDGYLISLDASTRSQIWKVDTIADRSIPARVSYDDRATWEPQVYVLSIGENYPGSIATADGGIITMCPHRGQVQAVHWRPRPVDRGAGNR